MIDGEGTFYISIRKDNEYKLGWQIGAEFQIQLHKRDLNLLLQLQDFFSGTGSINISKTRDSVSYSVKSIKNITNIIIPHFLKYKLLTQKAADFILFNQIVKLINTKAHLTKEGLHQIINIKASLNLGISENLKSYWTKITPLLHLRNEKQMMVSLTIVKYSDITNLIIPFFKKYPVLGIKQNDFSDWCKIAKLMNDGSHLTIEGLNLIRTIKNGMNKGRK